MTDGIVLLFLEQFTRQTWKDLNSVAQFTRQGWKGLSSVVDLLGESK